MTLQDFKDNYIITLDGIKAKNNDNLIIKFDEKLFDIIENTDFTTWQTYKQLFDYYNTKTTKHLLPKQTHYTSKVSSVYLKAKDSKGVVIFGLFDSTNKNEQGEHLTNKLVKASEIGNYVFTKVKRLKDTTTQETNN